MLLFEFLRQSKGVLVVGLNIFLCIVLGLRLSIVLYLAVAFLQLMAVCFVVILCASIFAVRPISARSFVHCWIDDVCCGMGGKLIFVRVFSCWMSGWEVHVGYAWVVLLRMAFLMLWYILSCCFHIFCCLRGRKPPCW